MYNISYAAGDAATEGHFKIVGSLEADSKQLYWDSSKGFLVVPKVILQSITTVSYTHLTLPTIYSV